jgi:hypothetical protein
MLGIHARVELPGTRDIDGYCLGSYLGEFAFLFSLLVWSLRTIEKFAFRSGGIFMLFIFLVQACVLVVPFHNNAAYLFHELEEQVLVANVTCLRCWSRDILFLIAFGFAACYILASVVSD